MNGNVVNPNARHSYTNSDVSVTYTQQQQQSRNVSGGSSPFGVLATQTDISTTSGTRGAGHGHSRSGSSSNWGSFSQKNHLSANASPYAHTPSPGNDATTANAASASPWAAGDLNSNARQNDRTWS